MDSIVLNWTAFKNFINTWGIKNSIRYVVMDDSTYRIWVEFYGKVVEVSSGGLSASDVTDFETNYKPVDGTVWVAGRSAKRNDDAATMVAAANAATPFTYKITKNTFLWGGDIIVAGSASVDNDFIELQVVDVDGVHFPAGTVIREVITKKFIPPDRIISIASPNLDPSVMLAGLYLKVIYTETSGTAKTVNFNVVMMA